MTGTASAMDGVVSLSEEVTTKGEVDAQDTASCDTHTSPMSRSGADAHGDTQNMKQQSAGNDWRAVTNSSLPQEPNPTEALSLSGTARMPNPAVESSASPSQRSPPQFPTRAVDAVLVEGQAEPQSISQSQKVVLRSRTYSSPFERSIGKTPRRRLSCSVSPGGGWFGEEEHREGIATPEKTLGESRSHVEAAVKLFALNLLADMNQCFEQMDSFAEKINLRDDDMEELQNDLRRLGMALERHKKKNNADNAHYEGLLANVVSSQEDAKSKLRALNQEVKQIKSSLEQTVDSVAVLTQDHLANRDESRRLGELLERMEMRMRRLEHSELRVEETERKLTKFVGDAIHSLHRRIYLQQEQRLRSVYAYVNECTYALRDMISECLHSDALGQRHDTLALELAAAEARDEGIARADDAPCPGQISHRPGDDLLEELSMLDGLAVMPSDHGKTEQKRQWQSGMRFPFRKCMVCMIALSPSAVSLASALVFTFWLVRHTQHWTESQTRTAERWNRIMESQEF
ncbi:hypothetical protein NMY22_g12237 [Coprinellus aureogranulatus]|nr:hypothetical protein NMY22_g12237 [Coprinellus aureogranulatus]